MILRKVTEKDFDECCILMQDEHLKTAENDDPYFKREWLYDYIDDDLFFIAEENNEVVGLVFGESLKGKGAMLWIIVVKKELRRHGIGTLLMEKFNDACKKNNIEWVIVYAHNSAATLKFYKKNGYNFGPNCIESKKHLT